MTESRALEEGVETGRAADENNWGGWSLGGTGVCHTAEIE